MLACCQGVCRYSSLGLLHAWFQAGRHRMRLSGLRLQDRFSAYGQLLLLILPLHVYLLHPETQAEIRGSHH